MIGGIDIRLPTRAGIESIEVAVRAIRQLWARAVFEDGDTGDRYQDFVSVPFGHARELFVYRDAEAADIWDDKGAVPEVSNTMIHVLYDDGLITAVIDERTEEMNTIIDVIRSALDDSILFCDTVVRTPGGNATP